MENATLRMGAIVRQAREASARTQEHLAAEADVSVKTVQRAESTGVMSAETLRALCSVLELDAGEVKSMARAGEADTTASLDAWRRDPLGVTTQNISGLGGTCWMLTLCMVVFAPALVEMFQAIPHVSLWENMSYTKLADIFSAATTLALCSVPSSIVALSAKSGEMILWERTSANHPLAMMDNSFISKIHVGNGVLCLLAFCATLGAKSIYSSQFSTFPSLINDFSIAVLVQMSVFWLITKRFSRLVRRHRQEFTATVPGLLDQLEAGVSRSMSTEENLALIEHVLNLGLYAGRVEDVEALAYLREDLRRGLSGRRGQLDYIRVASALCACDPVAWSHPELGGKTRVQPDERIRGDGARATAALRQRVNLFASKG